DPILAPILGACAKPRVNQGVVEELWSTGNRRGGIEVGDDVLLFRQGDDRGIIASGHTKGEVHLADDGVHRVQVAWEEWVALEDRLPIDRLREIAPKFFVPSVLASGHKVDDDEAIVLKTAWNSWLQDRSLLSGEEAGARPLSKKDQVPEGAKTRVLVNRYERDPVARRRCLEHFGYQCQVCGLNFEGRYGEIGRGFMHVHHKTPLSEVTDCEDHLVNPTKDLVPVCPNCHAMLHRPKGRVLTVSQLQRLMEAAER
ncbi:MAG: hypothetical protein F4Z06_11640, partial [Acidimicrobiia bacterium]|nr:hypothetical protein [Acidimicrobiia bacterium]MYE74077.1 hypothetical protein [Acidimicrobiia bacterium]MYJ61041.1 hypothetical protein [Acidimicrobiia bacterium]